MSTKYLSEIVLEEVPNEQSYLKGLPVVQYLCKHPRLVLDADVTILVGENGTGKSTLLEAVAVACGFNPEGGSRNFNFSTNATHSELHKCLRVVRRAYPKDGYFLRAESLYNVATNIEELDRQPAFSPPLVESYGGRSLHHQSHGESFLALVQNRLGGNGLYLFDEPEAALSPMRQLTLLSEIDRLVKSGSQLLIATHSPILMAYPGACILELSGKGIRRVEYRETEHYRVTREFLENPERMVHYLLEE
ncbi:MAG: AAA family ATPase [Clostridia bacterium]|nr:AAA family ATPase [Clostridia bacterium]